jgi:hypothetical protein
MLHSRNQGGGVMSSTRKRIAGFVLFALFLCGPLQASVPEFIPYQGYLTDALGEPVSGSLDLHFAFYDQAAGGTALWAETHTGVAVIAGFFQVALGDLVPLADELFVPPLFLGITVDGEAEMTPRMRVGSVPFARISGELLVCSVGETDCDGTCVNLSNDPNHCSACNLTCGPSEDCVDGACCQLQTWYADDDGDGFGNCADSIQACGPQPSHPVSQCGDCDDSNDEIYPGAAEICNDGLDNNCNGFIDCDDFECDESPMCPL